jgi:hypothetical protein
MVDRVTVENDQLKIARQLEDTFDFALHFNCKTQSSSDLNDYTVELVHNVHIACSLRCGPAVFKTHLNGLSPLRAN